MLTSLDVINTQFSVPDLPLVIDNSSGDQAVVVKNILGLGPVKANVNVSPYGVMDGDAYLGATIGNRNIVFTFGLSPDWEDQSMEGLRQELYKYFMPKAEVLLRFQNTHLPECEILGYVESFEPNIFTRDPEIQISIICPRPDFIASEATVVNGIVSAPNPAPQIIEYGGNVPTGIQVEVEYNATRPTYTGKLRIAYQDILKGYFEVNPVTLIDADRYFKMVSVPGSKSVSGILYPEALVPPGTPGVLNYLAAMTAVSKWPVFVPGDNPFYVEAKTLATAGQKWKLTYFERFGGL